jgi:gliding motility-associated-like protein
MQNKLLKNLLLLFTAVMVHTGVSAQIPDPVETDTLAPYVTTATTVTNVTTSSAILGGNVTANGGATVTERGVVYSTTNLVPTIGDSKVIIGSGNGVYSQTVSGLRGGTTYYVRAYATNIIGTSYGTVATFTTLSVPPFITTSEVSAVTGTGATVGGDVTFSGGAAVTERGVVYSSSNATPTVTDTKIAVGTGTGVFAQTLTGLTPGTLYYLRAYAINAAGTSYGAVASFTTGGASVTSNTASSITTNTAVLGGEVTAIGASSVSERGIVLIEGTGTPTLADTKITMGSGFGAFSQTVTNLKPATTYSVRAYATNSTATNYGGTYTFTTKTTLLSINTTGQVITNAIVVTYALAFAEPVSGITPGNFSVTYTGTINNPYVTAITGAGTAWNVTAYTGTGEGLLTLRFVNDNGITPLVNNAVPVIGQTFTIDRTAPTMLMASIRSNNADTVWARNGDSVLLTFRANEAIRTPVVTIAGQTATVTDLGGNMWKAGYLTKPTDTDGIVPFTISITDIAGNTTATVTGTTNATQVNFDKINPAVTSINRANVDNTNAATVQFTVTFSDVVTGVDAADFSLTSLALSGASITGITGSGAVYTITVNTGTGNGTIRLDLKATGTGIIDRPGNPILTGFTTGHVYTIAKSFTTPVVKTNNPATVCTPSTVDLTAAAVTAGSDPFLTYTYYTDAAGTAPLTNPAAVSASGTYYIVGTNILNLSSAPVPVAVTILTIQKPVVSFNFDSYCTNKPVNFTSTSVVTNSGVVDYLWTDNNNHSASTANTAFTYTTAGTYNVKLKVSSSVCPTIADSLTRPVGVVIPTAAVRMPTRDIMIGEQVQLQAARTFGTSYKWTPATGLTNSTSASPAVRLEKEQQYIISIGEASGCVTNDSLLVRVFGKQIYVPTVFSPNGDGINDKLFVNLVNTQQLKVFRVFNRYGKKVFETTNVSTGWDGTFNGVMQPMDTYVWYVEAIDKGGYVIVDQKSVTLLR